jgi:hypothetical protein
LISETKNLLNNSALENIEIEYIKNLQQQVHFLEMECNYLYPFKFYKIFAKKKKIIHSLTFNFFELLRGSN